MNQIDSVVAEAVLVVGYAEVDLVAGLLLLAVVFLHQAQHLVVVVVQLVLQCLDDLLRLFVAPHHNHKLFAEVVEIEFFAG